MGQQALIPCGEGACSRRTAKQSYVVSLLKPWCLIWGRFAAQREQAPSPQGGSVAMFEK